VKKSRPEGVICTARDAHHRGRCGGGYMNMGGLYDMRYDFCLAACWMAFVYEYIPCICI
jgi:hypothetical protein